MHFSNKVFVNQSLGGVWILGRRPRGGPRRHREAGGELPEVLEEAPGPVYGLGALEIEVSRSTFPKIEVSPEVSGSRIEAWKPLPEIALVKTRLFIVSDCLK